MCTRVMYQTRRVVSPNARIEGVLVQEQAASELEVIVDGTTDPVFGKLVAIGLGGIMVEVLQDVTFGNSVDNLTKHQEISTERLTTSPRVC